MTDGFNAGVIVDVGFFVGDVAIVALSVAVELGVQDDKAIINSDDKKIILRKLIS